MSTPIRKVGAKKPKPPSQEVEKHFGSEVDLTIAAEVIKNPKLLKAQIPKTPQKSPAKEPAIELVEVWNYLFRISFCIMKLHIITSKSLNLLPFHA